MKLAQGLGFNGDLGRCRGWVDRHRPSQMILTGREDAAIDCVEQGYLEHALAMLRVFEAGDLGGRTPTTVRRL